MSNGKPDVVVAGAGIAGLSAAVLLARAGMQVVCVERTPFPRPRVGESLDWSAPALLADLGVPRDEVIASGLGTYKREIRALTLDGDLLVGRPPAWVHRWPFRFEYLTVHLDRHRFDRHLFELARGGGVEFVWDQVAEVEFDGDRIAAFRARSGRQFCADWFIDASGRRRLVARSSGVELQTWGRSRIAIWSHAEAPMSFDGTMLHLDAGRDELTWAWEIPLAGGRASVGAVMPLSDFRSRRESGASAATILEDQLARFGALRTGGFGRLEGVHTRGYRPYVSSRVSGANWFLVGEAAALVDPLTSIGVTSAIRHASEAAGSIVAAVRVPGDAARAVTGYDRRLRRAAALYNDAIDTLMYRPLLRIPFGIRWASRAYVTLGYGTSSLSGRLDPMTPARAAALDALLRTGAGWVRAWGALGRAASRYSERDAPTTPARTSARQLSGA